MLTGAMCTMVDRNRLTAGRWRLFCDAETSGLISPDWPPRRTWQPTQLSRRPDELHQNARNAADEDGKGVLMAALADIFQVPEM
jgi:hypothetical protein